MVEQFSENELQVWEALINVLAVVLEREMRHFDSKLEEGEWDERFHALDSPRWARRLKATSPGEYEDPFDGCYDGARSEEESGDELERDR